MYTYIPAHIYVLKSFLPVVAACKTLLLLIYFEVYQMENEKDRLLENQFTRNDGKSYQPPRGKVSKIYLFIII